MCTSILDLFDKSDVALLLTFFTAVLDNSIDSTIFFASNLILEEISFTWANISSSSSILIILSTLILSAFFAPNKSSI